MEAAQLRRLVQVRSGAPGNVIPDPVSLFIMIAMLVPKKYSFNDPAVLREQAMEFVSLGGIDVE
jgi:hypothetical protein